MAKEPVMSVDILPLCKLVKDVFNFISELREGNVLAEKIKYPQIPQILSESIVLYALNNKNISIAGLDNYRFEFGSKRGEPDVKAIKKSTIVNIEVKATAVSAFQYFSEKDIKADYLIWIHFDDFFERTGFKPVEVYIIKKPGDYVSKYPKSRKITLSKLKGIVGENLERYELDVSSL